MDKEEVLGNLCCYDPRNPNNSLWAYEDSEEKPEANRPDCACDNCFYGRTKLALEILRLRGETSL